MSLQSELVNSSLSIYNFQVVAPLLNIQIHISETLERLLLVIQIYSFKKKHFFVLWQVG